MTAKKDAYVQKLKAKIDQWDAELDKLTAKADQVEADSKIEYAKQVEDLRAKRKDLEDKIAKVQKAGDEAWEDLKRGVEDSWEILKISFSKAKTGFMRGYQEGRKGD